MRGVPWILTGCTRASFDELSSSRNTPRAPIPSRALVVSVVPFGKWGGPPFASDMTVRICVLILQKLTFGSERLSAPLFEAVFRTVNPHG